MVAFQELLKRLHDESVDFVVIGGIAANLNGSSIATIDLDIIAPMTTENLRRIVRALRPLDPRVRMRPDKMRLPEGIEERTDLKNLYLLTDLGIIDLLGELPGIGS